MVLSYKCPSCGADMVYDSEKGKLVCGNCGNVMEVDEVDAGKNEELDEFEREEEFKEEFKEWDGDVNVFKCSSCGAELITDKVTAATFCSFCGAPTIIPSRLDDTAQPSKVIPFKISKEQAQSAFKKWCKNGLITPAGFASADRISKISGIYVPFWIYDCTSRADISANCTRVSVRRQGNYEITKTDHYYVQRDISADFLKVPADASEKMDDNLMDLLEPYDYSEFKEFKIPYLSGYLAEKYSYSNDEVYSRVKSRVNNYAEDYARAQIRGYSTVVVNNKRVVIKKRKADYVLLPVWILNYDYKGKIYTFAMNGQTGKLVGKPPIEAKKVVLYSVLVAFITFIIVSLLGGLMV